MAIPSLFNTKRPLLYVFVICTMHFMTKVAQKAFVSEASFAVWFDIIILAESSVLPDRALRSVCSGTVTKYVSISPFPLATILSGRAVSQLPFPAAVSSSAVV